MKNLVPEFIIENYKNNNFEGEFQGFALFIDISGFTQITEKLMSEGNDGAETFALLLKNIFENSLHSVYNSGGFTANFAGDGFTAIYPSANKLNAKLLAFDILHSARKILSHFIDNGFQKTKFGDLHFKVKAGLSYGIIKWAIIGKAFKSYYFKGQALERCIRAQNNALENEIIVDKSCLEFFDNSIIKTSVIDNNSFRLDAPYLEYSEDSKPANISKLSGVSKEIFSKKFTPSEILKTEGNGEFRNVVSIFISFNHQTPKNKLNNFFEKLIEKINFHSGYLKDIDFGDKGGVIVCYFGAPFSYDNNVQRAVNFLIQLVNEFKIDKLLNIKAGITYGKVFAGLIGGEERVQYSMIGSKVNLAARLMDRAKRSEIIANETIYQILKDDFKFVNSGEYIPKGFADAATTYILSEKDTSNSQETHKFPMVGREVELKLIISCIKESFRQKKESIITIYGEAGIGKSKLIQNVKDSISKHFDINWIDCANEEILRQPLKPFGYFLKNLFNIYPDNTDLQNKNSFNKVFDGIIKDLTTSENNENDINEIVNELERTKSILGALADIFWENSLYEKLDPRLRAENSQFAIYNLILSLCIIKPVVLIIEDAHWMDSESKELLGMLMRNLSEYPFTVLLTSRYLQGGGKLNFTREKDVKYVEVELRHFGIDDIEKFAETLLGYKLDKDLSGLLRKQTNGNPYFIEHLLLDFNERGLLTKKGNTYSLNTAKNDEIPSNIYNVIISRFDRLSPEIKEIVQSASVLGNEFELLLLKKILPNAKDVESKFKMIENEKIWRASGKNKYTFNHAILREAIYSMQLSSQVRKLHLTVSGVIEKQYKGKVPLKLMEYYSYHYGIGNGITDGTGKIEKNINKPKTDNIKDKITNYLTLKETLADNYTKEYKNEKAIELYDSIIKLCELIKDKEKVFYTLLKKADIFFFIGKWENAEKVTIEINKHSKNTNDKTFLAYANKYNGKLCGFKNEYDKGIKLLKKSSILFRNNKKETIDIYSQFGKLFSDKGDFRSSLLFYSKQYSLAKNMKDVRQLANSLNNMGTIYRKIGDYDLALSKIQKYYKISTKLADKNDIAISNLNLGNIYYFKGDIIKSVSYYKNALKFFNYVGSKKNIAITLGNIGSILLVQKKFDKAKSYYHREMIIYRSLNDLASTASSYGKLGTIYYSKNELNKSLEYFDKQLQIVKQLKRKQSLSYAFGNIGLVYEAMGKYREAINYYDKQHRIDVAISNREGIMRANFNTGSVYKKMEKYKEAAGFFSKSIKIGKETGLSKGIILGLNNYSDVLFRQNRFKDALKTIEESIILSEKYHLFEELTEAKRIKKFIETCF